jgi:hypothetical protein
VPDEGSKSLELMRAVEWLGNRWHVMSATQESSLEVGPCRTGKGED